MKKASATASADSVNEICSIRVELLGSDPLIWRELEVPTSTTFRVLHDIIQIVMGWFDYHLWEFSIGERRYGPRDPDDDDMPSTANAATVRLRDVLKRGRTVICYVYDFGDYWENRLTVSKIRQADPGVCTRAWSVGSGPPRPRIAAGCRGFMNYSRLWVTPIIRTMTIWRSSMKDTIPI